MKQQLKEQFNAAQISKVIDQALIYQCACPAQVCKSIFELRELFDYQMNCASDSKNDALVHKTIAAAAEVSHEIMEKCLKTILEIEGWDQANLNMPESLKQKSPKLL
jgi:hypothetical protein